MKSVFQLLLISLIIFVLSGCGLEDRLDSTEVTPINEVEQTEYFRDGALEHILEGELNRHGQATGFHYDQLPTKNGEIIEGTETKENEFGVYEAEVIVSDVKKNSNGGRSTFFPDDWDTQEVIDAINEAYDVKEYINGNTYEGLTTDGLIIRMYLDQQDKIISAFPVY